MGFLVSQHGQLGAIPPPPFLSVSPLESMRSGGAIPPLRRGISAILARYPMKTRQMGAIPPSAILSRKRIARYGGVSRTGPHSGTFAYGLKTETCRFLTNFLRVARLQSEFYTKDFFRATNFLTKNAPQFSPKFLSLCSVGPKKNPRKFPPNFPLNFPNFPAKKKKKFTDELLQERREKIFL